MANKVSNDEFLRKRAIRQKKIRKRRLKIFFVIMLILSILTSVILCLTVFFPIEKINFKGSKIYTSEQLLKASGIEKGDNLFTVSKSEIESRLRKKLPYVEEIKLERKLPETLNVKVTDAEEFACYFIDNKHYIVSQSGWVLKTVPEKPTNIYTVYGAKAKCKVGSQIEFLDSALKDLTDELSAVLLDTEIKINSIDVSNILSINLQVEDRFEVKLGTSNFLNEKIKHLSGMIEKISENDGGKIDLSMWANDNSQGTFTPIIRQ